VLEGGRRADSGLHAYSDAVTFTPVIKLGEVEIEILNRTRIRQCRSVGTISSGASRTSN